MPEEPAPLQSDYLQEFQKYKDFGDKLLNDNQRSGVMSDIQVQPIIIEEILYPNELVKEVIPYVEAAIQCYNIQNYIKALQNFEKAQSIYVTKYKKLFTDELHLFFEYMQAQIYSSAGRDDYALRHFLNSKIISDRLPYVNPDRSLAYSGLGSIMYQMEEYELGIRCLLKARQVREELIGVENVETALIYNNLGCCFLMISRTKVAYAYFQMAKVIFECELGAMHSRTMTAGKNIMKAEKGYFENIPKFRPLWETYDSDPYAKKKKKKKKKK